MLGSTQQKELPVLWNQMPAELRKSVAVKRAATVKTSVIKKQKKKADDPDKIFAKLEEKEKVDIEGEGVAGLTSVLSHTSEFL